GERGETAVFIAAQRDNDELLRLLERAGADAGIPNDKGVTPLMQAARFEARRAFALLLATPSARVGLDRQDDRGVTSPACLKRSPPPGSRISTPAPRGRSPRTARSACARRKRRSNELNWQIE